MTNSKPLSIASFGIQTRGICFSLNPYRKADRGLAPITPTLL